MFAPLYHYTYAGIG